MLAGKVGEIMGEVGEVVEMRVSKWSKGKFAEKK